MKKILLLLLISISGYSQTLLKLKAIEYAPGAGYCVITNSLGVQTYTPCSSLSSTVIPTLQQVTDVDAITTNPITAPAFGTSLGFSNILETGAIFLNGSGTTNLFEIDNTIDKVKYNGNEIATTNQLPVLTASTGITISGTTPNYTLSATGSSSTTVLTASTNITISGTAPNYTISTPTQTTGLQQALTAGTNITINTNTISAASPTLVAGSNMSVTTSGLSYTVSATTQTTGLASLTGTETLTNKRITVRTSTTTTTATITVNSDSYDLVAVTTLSTATTFTAPTGTPTEGQGLIYRIKDNGTARALTFNSVFRFSSDVPAPTTTIVSKWMYIYFVYNLTDAKWDCLTIATNY